MDDIADRAGVSKPVLYQHFPGKLELYLALLDESADKLVAIVRDALSSTTDNRERVPATFRAFFDFVGTSGEAFRLVDALESKDLVTLSPGLEDAEGNRAVISARTGLDAVPSQVFIGMASDIIHSRAKGGTHRLRAAERP